MLDYIARKNILLCWPLVMLPCEIDRLFTIEKTGNKDFVLMQCITNYPSKLESANVNVLKTYQSAFGCLTGYSDHAPGPVVAIASVVLGGRVIEKHFTLNKKDKGPDHPHSMEPAEFKFMVDSIREVEKAMGSTRKEVQKEEGETVFVQRRCLYAKHDLKKPDYWKKTLVVRPALENILLNIKNGH